MSEASITGVSEDLCIIFSTPVERREKLRELGVDESVLVEAIQRGAAEKMTAENYDPSTAGGYDFYRYATRHLREKQHATGWELQDKHNIPLIRDPENGTIFIVCSGDSQTGMLIGNEPRTKRPKGKIFLEVTEVVSKDLFGHEEVITRRVPAPEAKVWLLLHYHIVEGDKQVLRAELSRPKEAVKGMITTWAERIILHTPLPGTFGDDYSADDKGPTFTPNIVVNF